MGGPGSDVGQARTPIRQGRAMDSGVRWLADSEWYFCVTFGLSVGELGTRLAADPE